MSEEEREGGDSHTPISNCIQEGLALIGWRMKREKGLPVPGGGGEGQAGRQVCDNNQEAKSGEGIIHKRIGTPSSG